MVITPPLTVWNAAAELRRWERLGLITLGLFFVAFAGLIELRAAFQKTRKTDFGVYVRAAWAVRSGEDLYKIVDNNRYHYTYPPAFAVLMMPLADAPAGVSRAGLLPFWASVAIWTLLNYLLVIRTTHVLASLILPDEPTRSRRWWYARTVPVYVAIGGIGYSVGFGQVNVVLVSILVEMLRCSLTNKRFASGLWLASAIVMKVMPAFLVLYPLLRKDGRSLLGLAAGMVLGVAAIPVAGMGVERTLHGYQIFAATVLMPGLVGGDANGVKELVDMPSNDNQSFLALIHGNLYPDKATQPATASVETKLAHVGIVGLLTLATVIVALRRGMNTASDATITLGLLMVLMLHAVPMSHMHYYAFGWPLVAGLWLKGLESRPGASFAGWGVLAPLMLWGVGTALPLFPGATFEMMRDRGMGLVASMVLWGVGLRTFAKRDDVAMETLSFDAQKPQLRQAA
ncbi:hypothetical protein BH11PLA2_BH11PLA2_49910 [soil metagenome]